MRKCMDCNEETERLTCTACYHITQAESRGRFVHVTSTKSGFFFCYGNHWPTISALMVNIYKPGFCQP